MSSTFSMELRQIVGWACPDELWTSKKKGNHVVVANDDKAKIVATNV